MSEQNYSNHIFIEIIKVKVDQADKEAREFSALLLKKPSRVPAQLQKRCKKVVSKLYLLNYVFVEKCSNPHIIMSIREE